MLHNCRNAENLALCLFVLWLVSLSIHKISCNKNEKTPLYLQIRANNLLKAFEVLGCALHLLLVKKNTVKGSLRDVLRIF